jgi:hypothetical protein
VAKKYLERLSRFVEGAASVLPGGVSLECKHFFSGAALYAEGRICISLTPAGLAMKLPEETKDSLFLERTAVPLRYFPEGPVKKGYALFPVDAPEVSSALHGYLKKSIEYVLTLPKPKRKQK